MSPTLVALLAMFQASCNEGRALSLAAGCLEESAAMARDGVVILCAGCSKACAKSDRIDETDGDSGVMNDPSLHVCTAL